jgi:hypothetical protein
MQSLAPANDRKRATETIVDAQVWVNSEQVIDPCHQIDGMGGVADWIGRLLGPANATIGQVANPCRTRRHNESPNRLLLIEFKITSSSRGF